MQDEEDKGEIVTCPDVPYGKYGDKMACFSYSDLLNKMVYRGCANEYPWYKLGECVERHNVKVCICDQDKCNVN